MLLLGLVEFIFCYFTSHYDSCKGLKCVHVLMLNQLAYLSDLMKLIFLIFPLIRDRPFDIQVRVKWDFLKIVSFNTGAKK